MGRAVWSWYPVWGLLEREVERARLPFQKLPQNLETYPQASLGFVGMVMNTLICFSDRRHISVDGGFAIDFPCGTFMIIFLGLSWTRPQKKKCSSLGLPVDLHNKDTLTRMGVPFF